MDMKVKHIKWMGDIYQKFEAVCQDVDDIVGQDAVKYLENGVQNVGGSMKKFYSGVVHELLPFPKLVSPTKFEPHSVKSVGGGENNNTKNWDEQNPINNFINALQDCKAISLANYQQAGAPDSVNSDGGGQNNHKTGDEEDPIDKFIDALQDSNAISLANDQQAGSPDSVKSVGGAEDNHIYGNDGNPIDTFIAASQDSNAINLANDQEADSAKSDDGGEDNHKNGDEVTPIDNFIKALQDSNAISLSNDQQAGVPDMHELVNQTSSETCADSLEVEDCYVTQKEVADDSRETAVVKKESIHSITKEAAIKSAPELINLISVKEKDPLEFSLHSESYFGSSDSAGRVSVSTKDNKEVNLEQESCLIVEERDTNSSAAQVLNSTPLGEKELTKASLFRKSSGVDKEDTGSYSSVRCESPQVAGLVMQSHDGLVSSSFCQSKELNDELRISSIESRLEDIQLNDDTKLEESCVFVDDKELYAASRRVQKLRSYKKRIQDAFTSKRLAKEYEQLAIWYGDTDFESKQDLPPQSHLPFRSKAWVDPKQLRMQQASETEWELL